MCLKKWNCRRLDTNLSILIYTFCNGHRRGSSLSKTRLATKVWFALAHERIKGRKQFLGTGSCIVLERRRSQLVKSFVPFQADCSQDVKHIRWKRYWSIDRTNAFEWGRCAVPPYPSRLRLSQRDLWIIDNGREWKAETTGHHKWTRVDAIGT